MNDEARGRDPSAETRAAIRAAVQRDLAPVRAATLGARAAVVLGGIALALAMAAPSFGMNLTGAVPDYERGAIAGAVVTLLGTLSIVGSFAPAGHALLGPRGKLAALAALLVGWAGYLLVIATTPASVGAAQIASLACAMRSIVSGAFAGAAAIWAFRYADPWTPGRTGALIGAAAGCVAAAGVGIGCGSSELGHLLVGHGVVVPLLAVAGAWIARRKLSP